MIDGVELHLLDQVQQVRELEGGDALGAKQDTEAVDEIGQVGDVGEHIVGRHQVSTHALPGKTRRCFAAEKRNLGGDALGDGGLGGASGRLDAQYRDVPFKEVLQEVTVVAGDFHDLGLRAKLEARDHRLGVAFCVRDPARRVGREIGVVRRKDFTRGYAVVSLGKQAVGADAHDQGIGFFARLGAGDEVGVGERLRTEIDERRAKGGLAGAAGGSGHGADLSSSYASICPNVSARACSPALKRRYQSAVCLRPTRPGQRSEMFSVRRDSDGSIDNVAISFGCRALSSCQGVRAPSSVSISVAISPTVRCWPCSGPMFSARGVFASLASA